MSHRGLILLNAGSIALVVLKPIATKRCSLVADNYLYDKKEYFFLLIKNIERTIKT